MKSHEILSLHSATQGSATNTLISTSDIPTLMGLAAMPIDPANPVPLGSVDATPVEQGQPKIEVYEAEQPGEGVETLVGEVLDSGEEE